MNELTTVIQYPITIFSLPHVIFMLVLFPLTPIVGRFLAKKYGFSKKVIWVYAVIGLICEIERMLFFLEETTGGGYRLPPNHLPLNTCPLMVIFMFILALSEFPHKKRNMIAYMYPMLVGGGFIGFLIPSAAVDYHGLIEVATYRYFFFHAMTISFGFYVFMSKPFEFTMRDYGMGLFLSGFMLLVGVWLNAFFGWDPEVNQMFVVRPPLPGLPLLNMRFGWPGYILNMMGIGLFLISLCYLPVIITCISTFIKKLTGKAV